MGHPFISVIVPTYNRPYQLGELVESLSRQTYRNFEVIIINDHGENIDRIKIQYGELDIHIINLEANRKDVRARNIGLAAAKGEYIMLLDDDDFIVPGHMEHMLRTVQANEADFAYSDAEIFDYVTIDRVRVPTTRRVFSYEHNMNAIRRFSTFIASGCLYKKSIHDKLGPFDPQIANHWDWDFFLRVLQQFRVVRVHRAGIIYAFTTNGDNMSADHGKMRLSLDRLSEKHGLGELPTKNFLVLLEEPELKQYAVPCEIVWDGEPIISRLATY